MKYFQNQIAIATMFGQKLSMPNAQNATEWLERIENELSPENLSCDGELRGARLMAKKRDLLAARQHVMNIVGRTMSQFVYRQVLPVDPYQQAFGVALQHAKRQRTADRMTRLDAAVQQGFTVGARIVISNGTTGTIVKVNRTRVKVKGDDGRMWSVPPRCMTLEQ